MIDSQPDNEIITSRERLRIAKL